MTRVFATAVLFLVASGCILSGTVTVARADTLLRYKFTKGQKLTYETKQTVNTEMDTAQGKMSTKVESTITVSKEVKDIDDEGKAAIVMTIDRIKMSTSLPNGQSIEYDSEGGEDSTAAGAAIAKQCKDIVGKSIEMKMDTRGRVSNVEMPEAMKSNAMLKSMMSGDDSNQLCGDIVFPKKAVAVGKTWTTTKNNVEAGPVGTINAETTHEYMGKEDSDGKKLEKINLNVKMTFAPKDSSAVSVTIDDAKTTGTIYFDNKAGRTNNSEATSNMTMTITANGQSMKATVELKVELKLLKEEGTAAEEAEETGIAAK